VRKTFFFFYLFVLDGVIFTLKDVLSDRDVRTRSAASRNVDLETRYVNRMCWRVLREGWGKRDNNKRYTMRRMVLQYRVERVSYYKYGRYRHRCR
jgi:hypothetical protein